MSALWLDRLVVKLTNLPRSVSQPLSSCLTDPLENRPEKFPLLGSVHSV